MKNLYQERNIEIDIQALKEIKVRNKFLLILVIVLAIFFVIVLRSTLNFEKAMNQPQPTKQNVFKSMKEHNELLESYMNDTVTKANATETVFSLIIPEPTSVPTTTAETEPSSSGWSAWEEYEVTWYTLAECGKSKTDKYYGITASGTKVKAGRTIAVDPRLIPYGSIVEIQGKGTYVAEDCGGGIKGHDIDIYVDSLSDIPRVGRTKLLARVKKP